MSCIKLIKGNCENILSELPSNKFDMILTCPPYGVVNDRRDKPLNWKKVWQEILRISKNNAAIVLITSQKLEYELMQLASNYYRFSWYWVKEQATNFCNLKIRPGNQCSPIPVFSKSNKFNYFPQMIKLEKPLKRKIGGYDKEENVYKSLNRVPITVNRKSKFPSNVIHVKRDVRYKFAQPIMLMEHLIKSHTRKSDIILDFTMGYGTTPIACMNNHRHCVGIELDEKTFKDAMSRVKSNDCNRQSK